VIAALGLVIGLGGGVTGSLAQADPSGGSETAPAPAASQDPAKAAQQAAEAAGLAKGEAAQNDPKAVAAAVAEKEALGEAIVQEDTANAQPVTIESICGGEGYIDGAPPYKGDDFNGTSGWAQIIDGECVKVWVGQAGIDDAQDGAVLILTTSLLPTDSSTAPGKSGSAPGQTGTAPGKSGSAPGQTGAAPGLAHHLVVDKVPGSGKLTAQSAAPGLVIAASKTGKVYTIHGKSAEVTLGRG